MSTQLVTTPDLVTPTPEEQERSRTIDRCLVLVESVSLTTVTNAEQYEQAGQFMIALKSRMAEVEKVCKPFKDFFHSKHKQACTIETNALTPAEDKYVLLNRLRREWAQGEERKRLAEQERINKELREKQEADQKRIADEQRLQAALDAEAAGHVELAEKIISQPTVITPAPAPNVVLQSTVPKTKGISTREKWVCEVTDMRALVEGILAGHIPWSAIEANTVFLGQQARSLKSEMNAIYNKTKACVNCYDAEGTITRIG